MSASSSSARKLVRIQYPRKPNAYRILEQIGGGARDKVHKAMCVKNSSLVAIKIIDLDQYSERDFYVLRREIRAMLLHSHPNVLSPRCTFQVRHYIWLVMPYMAAGSLQSIVSSSFPNGLLESSIAIVLKETLKGLYYLHRKGHLYTDIKAGNILIDHRDNGSIKLEGSVMSVWIYDSSSIDKSFLLSSSSKMRLTDVAGTPYWMAPEVIQDSETGYSFKADIWSFGVTALELAHGGPPFSHLPLSKSLMLKIKKRFGFSEYDHDEKREKDFKNNLFSQAFKDMVAACLDQDPSRRPSADQLLEYSFFKNCEALDLLFNEVLRGLPNVEERSKEPKALHDGTSSQITAGTDSDSVGSSVKTRRISGWKFNESNLELEPEYFAESKDDAVVKTVTFGGETIIDTDTNIGFSESPGRSGDLEGLVGDHTGANMSRVEGTVETLNQETAVLDFLVELRRSLDRQRRQVASMILQLGGMADGEEQMVRKIENLMEELDLEKEKNFKLKMKLENINPVISGASNAASGDSLTD